MMKTTMSTVVCVACLCAGNLPALEPGTGYSLVGEIKPRHAKDITSSNWSVGAETMGRDYTIYANWKSYLGPLGVKKARIQSGWAKTERRKGRYDWAWLDEIIPDMVARGVEPWVCLCYGNPVYPGGGGTGLSGGLPASPEARAAWERFVAAFVDRYKEQVDEWEIWNEPGLHGSNSAGTYAAFFMRTARVVRKKQPKATIIGLALPGIPLSFAKGFFEHLKKKDAFDLLDVVSYHPYSYNPDDSYGAVRKLRDLATSYAPHVTIFQGENGAPSIGGKFGALSNYRWNEQRQAKWAVRRLLGDRGHDIPSSYFAICDMIYTVGAKGRDADMRDDPGSVRTRLNSKGLLAVRPDKTVDHPKRAYRAVQNVTAVFDSRLTRVTEKTCTLTGGRPKTRYPVFHYRSDAGAHVITLWRGSDRPGEDTAVERFRLTVDNATFAQPVLVDMLTGAVFGIDAGLWEQRADTAIFRNVPVYDSVVLVAERGALPLKTTAKQPAAPALDIGGAVTVRCDTENTAVRLAVADLIADLEKVLGKPARHVASGPAGIVVTVDGTIGGRERWTRDVTKETVTIAGSDALGAVFGVYAFARDALGVDPLWFWKDLPPEKRDRIRVTVGRTASARPVFRYRGWFVNDEDLLTEWKQPSGKRFIRYPFYDRVIAIDVADRIYEALLRSGGNLVIPASFVDVMNPPEAALVRRAAARGLYVTQHHIEPLGVSHFGFENYWENKGKKQAFSYGDNPDSVREAWRAFAGRWAALAGDRVVWQLGLRGKGDTAIWNSDRSVSRTQAGTFISRAVAEQFDIARQADPRPDPPATTTLWLEGSTLMSDGSLTFPENVTIVFADEGAGQQMQEDFATTPRRPGRAYGAYYHVGFWSRGSHLLQGTTPRRVKEVFDRIVAKGDTAYAIINVCNIREHVLGIAACMKAMHGRLDPDRFMREWRPPCLQASYDLLLDSFIPLGAGRLLQDGAVFQAIRRGIETLSAGKTIRGGLTTAAFDASIRKLDRLIAGYPADRIPPRMRDFYDVHLLTQARMWRALLKCIRDLKLVGKPPGSLAKAETALEEFIDARSRAARGRWKHWYRGDKKVNAPRILRRIRAIRRQRGQ